MSWWSTRILLSLVAVLSACNESSPNRLSALPCSEHWRPLPLGVGDTTRMKVGSVVGSDCRYVPDARYRWSTPDTHVVDVTPDGLIRGRAPGRFHVLARRDQVTLKSGGFVMPSRWTLRAEPESASVRVGDGVRFRAVVLDTLGREVPGIPYSLFTPEFDHPEVGETPVIDKYSYQLIDTPIVVRAVRAGTTTLRVVIGARSARARLQVAPR